MYSINYSNLYMDDFAEALIYIKDVLKNEDASNNLKNKTNEEIQKLKSFPHTGTRLYKDNIETKYRYIRVDNYYVFYYHLYIRSFTKLWNVFALVIYFWLWLLFLQV